MVVTNVPLLKIGRSSNGVVERASCQGEVLGIRPIVYGAEIDAEFVAIERIHDLLGEPIRGNEFFRWDQVIVTQVLREGLFVAPTSLPYPVRRGLYMVRIATYAEAKAAGDARLAARQAEWKARKTERAIWLSSEAGQNERARIEAGGLCSEIDAEILRDRRGLGCPPVLNAEHFASSGARCYCAYPEHHAPCSD